LIPAAVGLGAATVDAASGGSDDHGGHPPLGAHAEPLQIPAGASAQERFELMNADFEDREHRIDWKSDSVRKRIRWALDAAEEALAAGDVDAAEPRLDDAQALLDEY
jgi:3-oxoacyl-(acyl-carrier-protein) synthase